MKTKNDSSGFTFVELLVVIVVVAVLVLVALPSFATSKDHSQGARCLGNLRQLTAAWAAYTADNQGDLMPNGDEEEQPASLTTPGPPQWCPGRQDMVTQLSPLNASVNIGYEWIELGLLYPYVNNVSPYHCPADNGSTSAFGARDPHVRSVSMNGWLNPIDAANVNTNFEAYRKESDLVRPGPSQLFIFIDESPVSINDGSILFTPGGAQWTDSPATYHNGGAGISFADGHAQIKRWTDQTVLTLWPQQVVSGNPSFVELTPSQNPAVDLNFLQQASSYSK